MAAGLLYCAILLAGYIAAEINSGCCLCFYTVLAMAMMLLEAAVAGHLLLNEHWIQDLPYDRTGELDNLVSFVNNNLDLCKWAALATVITQALSLFLAMVLRAMVSPTSADYESDEDFVVIRRPLLLAQGASSLSPYNARPHRWPLRPMELIYEAKVWIELLSRLHLQHTGSKCSTTRVRSCNR